MFLRLLILLIFISVFTSCDFRSPKKSSLQYLTNLDTVIDYSSVDVYPLFHECNNCDSNEKQNLCFENELTKKLEGILNKHNFKASKSFKETVYADLLVDNTGKISLIELQTTYKIQKEIPAFDSIFKWSIDQIPNLIQPSLKRGIPVRSQFKLPIVVNVKE
ncbi:MAG: hypothetical protein ABFR32_10590 [Bacteroidota bacterium]